MWKFLERWLDEIFEKSDMNVKSDTIESMKSNTVRHCENCDAILFLSDMTSQVEQGVRRGRRNFLYYCSVCSTKTPFLEFISLREDELEYLLLFQRMWYLVDSGKAAKDSIFGNRLPLHPLQERRNFLIYRQKKNL